MKSKPKKFVLPEWTAQRVTANLTAKHSQMLAEILAFKLTSDRRATLTIAIEHAIEVSHGVMGLETVLPAE